MSTLAPRASRAFAHDTPAGPEPMTQCIFRGASRDGPRRQLKPFCLRIDMAGFLARNLPVERQRKKMLQ